MVADVVMELEKVARDAVRALEAYDAELASAFRHQLNALSVVPIGSFEAPISRAMKLESGLQFLLAFVDRVVGDLAKDERFAVERIDELKSLLRPK